MNSLFFTFRKKLKTNSHLLSCWSTLPTRLLLLCHNFTFRDGARSLRWGAYMRVLFVLEYVPTRTMYIHEEKNVFTTNFAWKDEWSLEDGKKYYDIVIVDLSTHVHTWLSNCTGRCYGKRKSNKQFSHRIWGTCSARCCCVNFIMCCKCCLHSLMSKEGNEITQKEFPLSISENESQQKGSEQVDACCNALILGTTYFNR